MAANLDMKGKDIPPGTKISCTTCKGVTHEGEVLAFDYPTKLLVIKTKVKQRQSEVKMINLSQTTHFDIKEEAKSLPPSLPPLDMQKIRKRHDETCREKQSEVDAVGIGVSPEGQEIFNYIHKTLKCTWEKEKIHVPSIDVTITPPYKMNNLQGNGQALEHVRKIMQKYYSEQVDGGKK